MSNTFKSYQVLVYWDTDIFVATVPDIPEAVADGATKEEALLNMKECIEACIAFRITEGEEIPEPMNYTLGNVMVKYLGDLK